VPGGWRLGGTATFAAVQASRLGLRAGIVTSAAEGDPPKRHLRGIDIACRPSAQTTTFENAYHDGRRQQHVPSQAGALTIDDVPDAWREAPVVLLGPVCGELPPALGRAFPHSLVGVSAQGWLRRPDRERRVRRRAWDGSPFWPGSRVLFVSDEDLGARRDQLARWSGKVPLVAVTRDRRGARVHERRRWRQIEAFPAREVDPTGAGDVFAAAFLIRYHESGDTGEAARFAAAAAACSVEGEGTTKIGTRARIERRMRVHPEIALR